MSSEPTAETHVFIGTFRPPLAEVFKRAEYTCPICHCLWRSASGEHPFPDNRIHCWSFGHFDTPVYKTIEEVVRLMKPVEVKVPIPPQPRPRSTMWPEDNGSPPKIQ